MSVNFSSVQFVQNDLAEKVLAIVERHGIPASCVRIEITESAIIANRDAVHAFMRTMNEHGVKFYLEGDAWVMMRPSGTEPLVRIYAEAETMDEVHALLKAAEEVVTA